MHSCRRGRAGRDLHDGCAQLDFFGMGADPGKGCQGVGAVGFSSKKATITEGFGTLRQVDQIFGRLRAPIPRH